MGARVPTETHTLTVCLPWASGPTKRRQVYHRYTRMQVMKPGRRCWQILWTQTAARSTTARRTASRKQPNIASYSKLGERSPWVCHLGRRNPRAHRPAIRQLAFLTQPTHPYALYELLTTIVFLTSIALSLSSFALLITGLVQTASLLSLTVSCLTHFVQGLALQHLIIPPCSARVLSSGPLRGTDS